MDRQAPDKIFVEPTAAGGYEVYCESCAFGVFGGPLFQHAAGSDARTRLRQTMPSGKVTCLRCRKKLTL